MTRHGFRNRVAVTVAAALMVSAGPAAAASAAPAGPAAEPVTPPPVASVLATPPMGWANWNSLGCNYNAAKIGQEADELVSSGLAAAGYKVVRIQECLFPTRDASGNLVPNPATFPDGIQSVVDYIHSKGLLAGVYTDAGTSTCAGYQGSYNHEQQDADTFASWGFDWVEVDWCSVPFSDFPGDTHEQVAQTLMTRWHHAVATAGRPMALYSFAGWDSATDPWQWGPQLVNAWRTGPDITMDTGNIRWAAIVSNFEVNAEHPASAGPGHYNDPDMLGVGLAGITAAEGRAMFSLWAISAAPLSIGTDLTNPSEFTAAARATYLNREVIAVDQDRLDAQGTLLSDDGNGHQIWRKPMADGSVALALFNNGATAQVMSATARQAGLQPSGSYSVRNLWQHTTTESAGKIAASVAPRSVVMLRVYRHPGTAGAPPSAVLSPPVVTTAAQSALPPVTAGSRFPVSVSLANNGRHAVGSAAVALSAPAGWTVAAAAPNSAGRLKTGQSLTAQWDVTVPPGTREGYYSLPVSLTSSPSLRLPASDLNIAVVGTGDTATACATLAGTNTDQGLGQIEYSAGGSGDGITTPVTDGGITGRQTVQQNPGNLNMYFQVDPRIASDGSFTATFTITYYDTGTGSWNLQYDSASAAYTTAATFTNHNTDTWKTATVTVPDARVDEEENGSADFRITSQDPVTVHDVQATISGPGVLPIDRCPQVSLIAASAPLDITTAPASATLTFQAPGPTAAELTSLAWHASPPAGITLNPSSGTLTFGAGGTATAAVTATATAAAAQGFYQIPVTFTSHPSVPLPAQDLSVAVTGTGDTATTCTTLAATNTDQGLEQVEYDTGDGVTTPVTAGGMSARQTVQATPDDLNMYFLVDPRIAASGTFAATFTITYYDTGTGSWNLQYDSASAAYTTALTVTGTNTGTWKTAAVTVPDAHFGQRENDATDFRISSHSPVTVHEAQVTVSGPGVLPVDLCPAG